MLRLAAIGAVLALVVVIALLIIGGPDSHEPNPAAVAAAEPAPAGEPAAAQAPRATDQGRVETANATPGPATAAAPAAVTTPPPPLVGGPFRLTDVNGGEVTEAALVGHPSLIAFGYTNCREACPPLADLGTWLETLGADGEDLAVYYVTVDPERDTTDILRGFLAGVTPRITGLTGTPAQVDAMLDQFQVEHARVTANGAPGAYDVEHPGWFYMHDAAAAFAGRIEYGDPPDTTLRRLRGLALASFAPEKLDALCGTLRATNRAAALAAWPSTLWLTCAERGFTEAQYGLALILDEGVFLTRDPREAYVWAIRAGQTFSELVVRLQEELRPAAVEAAITRAQNWTPTR